MQKALKWIVNNSNRQLLDIFLDARIVVSSAQQELENLAPAERAEVLAVSYYEPSTEDHIVARGLVLLHDTLYCCACQEREESWFLVESTRVALERLHRLAKGRHRSYDEAVATWGTYRLFAAELAAQLPMTWHPVGCDNPIQNVSGSTNGADHIVLDEAWETGRFKRIKNDALCQKWAKFNGNLFADSNGPTCKRCLFKAVDIVEERMRHLLEGSFDPVAQPTSIAN